MSNEQSASQKVPNPITDLVSSVKDQIKQQVAEIKGAPSKVPTALDVAQKKSEPPSPHPLTARIKRVNNQTEGKREYPTECNRPPTILDRKSLIDYIQLATTCPMVVIATPEEVEFLREKQEQVEKLIAEMEIFSTSNVNTRHFAIRDEHAEAIHSGKGPATQLIPSRNDVAKDSLHRLNAYMSLITKITHEEVVPVVAEILSRFEEMVFRFLRETEESDREDCRIKGLEFVASATWRAAASIAISYSLGARIPKPWAWTTPKTMLADVVDL